ncbi:MAG: OmpH family outer membrane protein [Alphaproteobacteria bacterium]|nr:OmpH family outer membrane protein [Emcibacter sp.]NOZ65923.1 OmpH family outer membrane protein [Alphaproteobacteria bacterium]HEC01274.1 OmpH family outer membrane protein [Sphingomonadales bacterium]
MNKILKITVMAAIVSAVSTFTTIGTTLAAEALPTAVIAVIDSRMVRFNSAAGKDIQSQLDKIRTKFQAEIADQEKTLKEEEATLKSQRSILPKESYDAKVKDFQNKVLTVQREVQIKNRQLETALGNAQNELQRALKPILQKILKEHKATMIMDVSLVIEKGPGLDVTTKVIEALDQVLPSIKVELPAANATPAAK